MARLIPNRPLISCCCASISVLLFLREDYQHIDSVHPETLVYALGHWCGVLMLACIGWLLVEMTLLVLSPGDLDRSAR